MLLMSKKKKNSVSNRPKLETRNNLSEFAVEDKKNAVYTKLAMNGSKQILHPNTCKQASSPTKHTTHETPMTFLTKSPL